jgi:hypothetical protein
VTVLCGIKIAVHALGLERISTDEILVLLQQVHGEVMLAAVQFKGDASTLRGRLMQDMATILQNINRVHQGVQGEGIAPKAVAVLLDGATALRPWGYAVPLL